MALKGNYVATSYANESAANTALGGDRARGSLYYDTTASKLKVWTGSAWSAVETPDLPEAVNGIGGLRLAWDFNKTACYDGTTHPGNSVHSDFRIVKNIAPDSPNNTTTNGGWIVDPRFIVRDSDTTKSGSWDGDNALTQDRKVFRPPASTGVHGNDGKHSPFDTTNGSHSTSSSLYGTEMVHNLGAANASGTANQEIGSFYFDNTGTAQDDNDDIATWVIFKRYHKWSGGAGGHQAGLISWQRVPNGTGYEGYKTNTVGGSFSSYDNSSNNQIKQALPTAHWAYNNSLNNTGDLTAYWNVGQHYHTSTTSRTTSDIWGGYHTLTSTNEHWQDNFNMYTYENHEGTDECINFYINDNATATGGIGEDWAMYENDDAIVNASRSNGYDHWAYGQAEAYNWIAFGGAHRFQQYSARPWTERGNSDWLYSATNYNNDRAAYPADIAVVLYFNKALTAANRETIYDAYKGQFGLAD